MVSGRLGGTKMWFPLRRELNFHIFGYLKISYLLEPKKYRFWVRFGCQVEVPKRTCWPQEASWTEVKSIPTVLDFELDSWIAKKGRRVPLIRHSAGSNPSPKDTIKVSLSGTVTLRTGAEVLTRQRPVARRIYLFAESGGTTNQGTRLC